APGGSDDQIKLISQRLFEGSGAPGHFVADESSQLALELNHALPPEVALPPGSGDIGFVHRRTSDAEIYFLANTGNTRQQATATFAVKGLKAEWWDPLTGSISSAKIESV